jgi:hypothetical protein
VPGASLISFLAHFPTTEHICIIWKLTTQSLTTPISKMDWSKSKVEGRESYPYLNKMFCRCSEKLLPEQLVLVLLLWDLLIKYFVLLHMRRGNNDYRKLLTKQDTRHVKVDNNNCEFVNASSVWQSLVLTLQ